MNNKRATKRALLTSVMALVMCVVMLVGTTFAWFTDTASTGVNKIVAGNLDIQLFYANNATGEGATWTEVDANTTLNFLQKQAGGSVEQGTDILWEPGCTYSLPALKIVNNGNLALKYKVVVSGIQGSAKLNEVIDWTMKLDDADFVMGSEHSLAAKNNDTVDADIFTISGTMDKNAGNEYQKESIDGINITVYATQDTVENDSFGNEYDEDAEYPISVTTGDELQAIVSNATAPVNIMLTNSITTNNFVIPADKDVTLDLNGCTVTNAGSHTILNKGHLTLTDSSADKSGQIISLKGNTAALRNGDNAVCVVEGGTISRDGANGNTWHVVENFGKMTFNGGKVVLKNGNGFAITNGWNYFDPGASTTHAVMEINALELDTDSSGIKNCRYGDLTVNDVTVTSTGYWALSNDYLGTAEP